MNIFSSKIELKKTINQQSEEIKQLYAEKDKCLKEIERMKSEIDEIKKENKEYTYTNLECDFCYSVIQKDFEFCPKCGKKIEKQKAVHDNNVKNDADIFKVENDIDSFLINQYNGFNNKSIVIPSSIDGRKIIGIWNSVFENCTEIEEVIFEEGCRYIGKKAFHKCTHLKKVKLPKSLLEIGDSAFAGCGIEEICIPPNVKVIGSYAFSYSSLKKILLPEGLKYISDGMLYNTLIEKINIPQSVLHIGFSAFSDTKLKSAELPDDLYSIGNRAFDIPTLKKITIHSNVHIIENEIFGKSAKPEIYCAAGSKALLYGRKHDVLCHEIPPKPITNANVCAGAIIIKLGIFPNDGNIVTPIHRSMGISKAATWSWKKTGINTVEIEKTMDMNDALELKNDLQRFFNSFASQLANLKVQELCVYNNWGESDV